jgi:beta-1,4-glucosyltransferase
MATATIDAITTNEVIALGGFPIVRTTSAALIPLLQQKMQQQQIALFFANTNFIVKCQMHKSSMSGSDTIIVNDGIGIDIAAWLVHRHRFIENLNGTDFTPLFLQHLGDKARVFLLGAKPGIAQRAAQTLTTKHNINVVGVRNGYDEASDSEALISAINTSNANVVLVAMGNPYQEQWILKYRHQLNAPALMGVGALLDFLAGDKARAPALVQRLRLEWFYRLCLEPSRLLRRYTVDIAQFLVLCLRSGDRLNNARQTEG